MKKEEGTVDRQKLLQELDAIIDSAYDGLFICDSNGVALRMNKSYERMTGLNASEIIGRKMTDLMAEGYYDSVVTPLVLEKKEAVTINQTSKNNRKLLATGSPIFDENGNLFRDVTNIRDISELVELQNQLTDAKEKFQKVQSEVSHLRALQMQNNDIIGHSPLMKRLFDLAAQIANVDSTVIIFGESGTGKELIAKMIHAYGKGNSAPFIKINCAAIPEQLLESELFGYEKGAFTSARKEGKPGMFELANNGTLFLDEIGELPLLLQAKLLRALQEKEIMRVGGTKAISINARVITATNQNIEKMVHEKKFREDLYYRLLVVPINVPSLRQRKEDIPLLAMYFVEKFNKQFKFKKSVRPEVMDKLMEYNWPGNVRELENCLERMIVTSTSDELTLDLLPESIYSRKLMSHKGTKLKAAVEQTEEYLLKETFEEYKSWPKTAQILGVDRTTVFRKAKKYGLLQE